MKLVCTVLVAVMVFAPGLAADVTHTVQAGDTLYSIARRYGVTVTDLMSDNGITQATRVRVGTKLVVKGVDAAAGTATATVDYVVQKDDTFWSVSRRNQLTVDQLKALNPGVDPARLRVGTRLKVPAPPASSPAASTGSGQPTTVAPSGTPAGAQGTSSAQTATQGTGQKTTAVAPPTAPLPDVVGRESELWPHPGPRTQVRDRHFQHTSIEARAGDPVLAVASGFVRWVSPFSTYANIVIIETRDGAYQFWYAGVDDVYVRTGEWVKKGATIARVATNGIDAKPRVAFGVYRGLTPIDHTRMIWQ